MDFNNFAGVENLYQAWRKFSLGKSRRPDVVRFESRLEENLFQLSEDLLSGCYVHGGYGTFLVRDPKLRIIAKAAVRERVAHQAAVGWLLEIYEPLFYFDSYSSRVQKGCQRAARRVFWFARRASRGFQRPTYIMHCDIEKFFDNVGHKILFSLLARRINSSLFLDFLRSIIESYQILPNKGLPLGNSTSQIFANIYLHQLDRFAKEFLRIKYYVRFNDDFFAVFPNRGQLKFWALEARKFLARELKLSLPKSKITITRFDRGADILGRVMFEYGAVLRKRTQKRALEKLTVPYASNPQNWKTAASYEGMALGARNYYFSEQLRLKGYG